MTQLEALQIMAWFGLFFGLLIGIPIGWIIRHKGRSWPRAPSSAE